MEKQTFDSKRGALGWLPHGGKGFFAQSGRQGLNQTHHCCTLPFSKWCWSHSKATAAVDSAFVSANKVKFLSYAVTTTYFPLGESFNLFSTESEILAFLLPY